METTLMLRISHKKPFYEHMRTYGSIQSHSKSHRVGFSKRQKMFFITRSVGENLLRLNRLNNEWCKPQEKGILSRWKYSATSIHNQRLLLKVMRLLRPSYKKSWRYRKTI